MATSDPLDEAKLEGLDGDGDGDANGRPDPGGGGCLTFGWGCLPVLAAAMLVAPGLLIW